MYETGTSDLPVTCRQSPETKYQERCPVFLKVENNILKLWCVHNI